MKIISYKSAKKYAELLFKLFSPTSVVDIGCGRGAWLKAFKEHGVKKCLGIDGDWNKRFMNAIHPWLYAQKKDS